jgi:RNA polymerase-binding transcription factor DksA
MTSRRRSIRIQAGESREIGFITRELVLERVNRLSAALDRMNAGEYGTGMECVEPISLARLAAMPENIGLRVLVVSPCCALLLCKSRMG